MQTSTPPSTPSPSKLRRVLGTIIAIVACNAVGILGALFTTTDSDWYRTLVKPAFQPPGWVFGPAWTLLYTLMGVAVYRIIERRKYAGARVALGLFAVQLFLNGIWSPIFFGAQAITAALLVIGLLVFVLAFTVRRFWVLDRVAAALLAPYLAWVTFATVLNAAIVHLN